MGSDLEIQCKLLNDADESFIPRQAYPGDAGFDLRAHIPELHILQPFATVVIPTGVAVEIPMGYMGDIRPRSGLSKYGIWGNIGTIDAGYRGELVVFLGNFSNEPHTIFPGHRIAQLVITPVVYPRYVVVTQLAASSRGERGLGSTGKE